MAVIDTWADWSATAASNSPAGAATPEIDDELRNMKAQCKANLMALADIQSVTGAKTFATGKLIVSDTTAGFLKNTTAGVVSGGNSVDAAEIADKSVTNTEYQYLGGVTAAIQTQLNSLCIVSPFTKLKVKNNAVTPNTQIDVDADAVVVTTGSAYYVATAVNLTINCATTGANGLDAGSLAINTWYYAYVIYNPTTTTVAGLVSTSSTAPTMPANYTYKKLVGAARTGGSATFSLFNQFDRKFWYQASMDVSALVYVPTSWTAIGLSSFIPPNVVTMTMLESFLVDQNSSNLKIFYGFVSGSSHHQQRPGIAGGYALSAFDIPIVTSQTIYWIADDAGKQAILYVRGYELDI